MGDEEQRLVALNVRVFKANEGLQSLDESQVIFLFRIITTAGRKLRMKDGAVVQGHLVKEEHSSLQVLPAIGLSTQISTRRLVCEAMEGLDSLINVSTRARLTNYICQYIGSFFKFDLQSQPQPPRENPPRIIISVDAYMEEGGNLAEESSVSSEVVYPLHEQVESEEGGDTEKRGDADQSDAIGYKMVLAVIPTREAQRRVTATEMAEICRTLSALLKEKKLLCPLPMVEGQPVALQEVEPAVTIQKINGVAPEDRCSICLEEISERTFAAKPPCSHVFHRRCLFAWLRRATSSTCPMCRGSCAATIC